MKRIFLILGLILTCNLMWMAFCFWTGPEKTQGLLKSLGKKDRIVIAVAGPMTGDGFTSGREMIRGAQLAIDEAVKAGKCEDKQIVLQTFDDQNDIRSAMKVASEISLDSHVMAVLGHYQTGTSIVAGNIYEKNGIPMVTGSATSEAVTDKNPWVFATVPDNYSQAVSIISQIRTMQQKISIIYDGDEYGKSLSGYLENLAQEGGLQVRYKWEINSKSNDVDQQVEQIISDLRATSDPGVIVFATQSQRGALIISAIKHPGTDYVIIGSDTFATPAFFDYLTELPQERADPGYYLNGIYVSTPFLPEWGGPRTDRFVREYKDKYRQTPSWVSSCYYDAMATLIEAIEITHIDGHQAREDRTALKNALSQFDNPEEAVMGVSGPVYFDKSGRSKRLYSMGYYENQRFRPAFTQFNVIAEKKESVFKEQIGSKVTVAGGMVLSQKHLVFTGVDINAIDSLNVTSGDFVADFYIWFRFKDDFDEKAIVFENAVDNITFGNPIVDIQKDGFTVRAYQIKAKFKQSLKYRDFPFEQHLLTIKFHHRLQTQQKLVFIPDYLNTEAHDLISPDQDQPERTIGWRNIHVSQSADEFVRVLGSFRLTYSRFNSEVLVERVDPLFALKILVPLLTLALVLLLSLVISFSFPLLRIAMILLALALAGICHYNIREIHPSTSLMIGEYNLYAIYILGMFCILITGIGRFIRTRGSVRLNNIILRISQIMAGLVILGMIVFNLVLAW